MPAQANADVVALQLEKVRDKVPLLYERDDILLTMIQQRGDVEKVSNRAMRIPLQTQPGGKGGHYNADGGEVGRGSGTKYDVATVSPVFLRFSIELTKLVEYATKGRERAVEDAAKRAVADGMDQFRAFLDMLMQTAGNGVIGTITSFASTTWTMTRPPGAALVYVGQTVNLYDSTLTTKRTGDAVVVSADPLSNPQTIVVDANPTGIANGDLMVVEGLSGANPTSLFGIKYHQSAAVTGTWQGLNRATAPNPVILATPRVNAANAALTPGNVRLAYNKVRKSLGSKLGPKVIAYCSPEQEHAWENLGITISQIIKEGAGGKASDLELLFNGNKTMGGAQLKGSIHADQTRIDFLDLSHWGRAVLKDIDFFEVGGKTVFPLYGAGGSPNASYWFAYDTAFQVFNDSPRSGAFIDALAVPSGY